ncbi:MAG: hypothetical protein ACI936_002867 [Paraglaciecola sp.]|jgi:hypothetical protein
MTEYCPQCIHLQITFELIIYLFSLFYDNTHLYSFLFYGSEAASINLPYEHFRTSDHFSFIDRNLTKYTIDHRDADPILLDLTNTTP